MQIQTIFPCKLFITKLYRLCWLLLLTASNHKMELMVILMSHEMKCKTIYELSFLNLAQFLNIIWAILSLKTYQFSQILRKIETNIFCSKLCCLCCQLRLQASNPTAMLLCTVDVKPLAAHNSTVSINFVTKSYNANENNIKIINGWFHTT